MPETWERARTNAQKEIREKEILESAKILLSKKSFEEITFSEIASQVSFSRANVYKYFQSKEEVYLSLLAEESIEFGKKAYDDMYPSVKNNQAIEFVRSWTVLLSKNRILLQLFSMAGTILEKNCSDEILLKSKTSMAYSMQNYLIPTLQRYFPNRSYEELGELIQFFIIIANGLHPLSGLNPDQKKLLRKNGLESMIHDFQDDYENILLNYFKLWKT
jgi:AcrR family transcriptional regulator